jgi:hypothetical protein
MRFTGAASRPGCLKSVCRWPYPSSGEGVNFDLQEVPDRSSGPTHHLRDAAPTERCPPRQKSRVEHLNAKVEPLLTEVSVDSCRTARCDRRRGRRNAVPGWAKRLCRGASRLRDGRRWERTHTHCDTHTHTHVFVHIYIYVCVCV